MWCYSVGLRILFRLRSLAMAFLEWVVLKKEERKDIETRWKTRRKVSVTVTIIQNSIQRQRQHQSASKRRATRAKSGKNGSKCSEFNKPLLS